MPHTSPLVMPWGSVCVCDSRLVFLADVFLQLTGYRGCVRHFFATARIPLIMMARKLKIKHDGLRMVFEVSGFFKTLKVGEVLSKS